MIKLTNKSRTSTFNNAKMYLKIRIQHIICDWVCYKYEIRHSTAVASISLFWTGLCSGPARRAYNAVIPPSWFRRRHSPHFLPHWCLQCFIPRLLGFLQLVDRGCMSDKHLQFCHGRATFISWRECDARNISKTANLSDSNLVPPKTWQCHHYPSHQWLLQ